jgi:hypothetical protein
MGLGQIVKLRKCPRLANCEYPITKLQLRLPNHLTKVQFHLLIVRAIRQSSVVFFTKVVTKKINFGELRVRRRHMNWEGISSDLGNGVLVCVDTKKFTRLE